MSDYHVKKAGGFNPLLSILLQQYYLAAGAASAAASAFLAL
jgi:hypothetical protein